MSLVMVLCDMLYTLLTQIGRRHIGNLDIFGYISKKFRWHKTHLTGAFCSLKNSCSELMPPVTKLPHNEKSNTYEQSALEICDHPEAYGFGESRAFPVFLFCFTHIYPCHSPTKEHATH